MSPVLGASMFSGGKDQSGWKLLRAAAAGVLILVQWWAVLKQVGTKAWANKRFKMLVK